MLDKALSDRTELEIHVHDQVLPVRTHPVHIEQLLMNLAVNANDAMRLGGKLTIDADLEVVKRRSRPEIVDPGTWARLRVSDTGVGIESEHLDHIFEPFYTRKKAGGVGLGLATVYAIVKDSGGYIFVDSKLGEGTTFDVLFPLVEGEASEMYRQEAEQQDLVRGSETILLVEDDPSVRGVTRQLLELLGYSVVESEAPEEAIEIYRREHRVIDMVLADVLMPKMDGIQMVEHLREMDRALKVLLMSGNLDAARAERARLLDNVLLLSKPFNLDQLATSVRTTLDTRRRGRPPKPRGLI